MGVVYMDKLNESLKSELKSAVENASYLYNLYHGVEKPDFSKYVKDWKQL